MPRPVTVTLSHDLGIEEARRRVRDGFDGIKKNLTGGMVFKFTENWASENSLEFEARGLGQRITGTIDVFPAHVRIEAVLPSVLAAIAETIVGKVEREGQILLEKK
ncbi:MAG: polyhydroxyalkanoic acid system family protein [Pseudomonadota bacterium]